MAIKYGIIGATEVQSELITTVGVESVMSDIAQATAEYNRQKTILMNSWSMPTSAHQLRHYLPGYSTLQPLDDHGNPQPQIEDGYFDVAFPIYGAGYAFGTNRVSRALMTVEQANRQVSAALRADTDWTRRHMLSAVFTDTTRTYSDDTHGNLTIQPLANGDSVTYVKRDGTSATDNHYLAQANAIADGSDNPFPAIYTELDEHPSNSGPYVAYVASSLVSSIEALTDLIEPDDPSLITSDTTTRLRVGLNPDVSKYEDVQPFILFGQRYIGRVNGIHIVEWASMPAGYMVVQSIGAGAFLGRREYPSQSLSGFFPEFADVDGNTMINRWLRYTGFGVMNRVAACVVRIGNGTYAEPTGYVAPLAV